MFCIAAGYGEQFGRVIATPGISEKGYMDVMINVASPGGHSSLPPPHTVDLSFKINGLIFMLG